MISGGGLFCRGNQNVKRYTESKGHSGEYGLADLTAKENNAYKRFNMS